MTIQDTASLASSIRTLYSAKYIEGAKLARVYDQFATPVEKVGVEKAARVGQTIQVNFLSAMTPATAAMSEIADITPQTLREATATISPTARADAVQFTEKLEVDVFTNYTAKAYETVGQGMMESVEILAYTAGLGGGFVVRSAARANLDAGTAGDRLTDTAISDAQTRLLGMRCPGFDPEDYGNARWIAAMHPDSFHDLRLGGNIVSIAQYQDKMIILANELGQVGPFRLVVSPFAKVFGAAGADNGTSVATTLSAAANKLATQIVVASASNITVGRYLTIGTEETANTFYPTNERVQVSAVYSSGTTVDVIGQGVNGGLLYDHASGAAVRNADSVYPVLYGGPMSMLKAFDPVTGEFGQVIGPKVTGLADQFQSIAYKFYGGYGIAVPSWILRGEYACSLDA